MKTFPLTIHLATKQDRDYVERLVGESMRNYHAQPVKYSIKLEGVQASIVLAALAKATKIERKTNTARCSRFWINQPSTLQPCHDMHGLNVIAENGDSEFVDVYFLDGETWSARIQRSALSKGWKI